MRCLFGLILSFFFFFFPWPFRFFFFFPLAAKLIGPQMGCQFFKKMLMRSSGHTRVK